MLLESFKTAPLGILTLNNIGQGNKCIKFEVDTLNMNAAIKELEIVKAEIESQLSATILVGAVTTHYKLYDLKLSKCGLGPNKATMTALIPGSESPGRSQP